MEDLATAVSAGGRGTTPPLSLPPPSSPYWAAVDVLREENGASPPKFTAAAAAAMPCVEQGKRRLLGVPFPRRPSANVSPVSAQRRGAGRPSSCSSLLAGPAPYVLLLTTGALDLLHARTNVVL